MKNFCMKALKFNLKYAVGKGIDDFKCCYTKCKYSISPFTKFYSDLNSAQLTS